MASWNCSDHRHYHGGRSNVVSATDHGVCVPSLMCAAADDGVQRHRCVVPAAAAGGRGAWTAAEDPTSPRVVAGPCPRVVAAAAGAVPSPFCPQRPVKVHPYMDASDAAVYCPVSRFPTSDGVNGSPCRTSATGQGPFYNSGTHETAECSVSWRHTLRPPFSKVI